MHLSVNFPLFISSCLTYVKFLVTELKHLRREVEELKGLMCRNNGKAFQVETCSFKVSALSLHTLCTCMNIYIVLKKCI